MNPRHHYWSELALALGFLAMIGLVPLSQTVMELARGGRVQFTEVLRNHPTASNLRQYEKTLEEKSWVQAYTRPMTRETLFRVFHDPGAKAVTGGDGWLFYRPDVRYLLEPDRPEAPPANGAWLRSASGLTRHQSVAQAILKFRDQLKARGLELVVMPVPGKPSIYPDKVTRRIAANTTVPSPTQELLAELEKQGLATIDLFSLFQQARTNQTESLYLATDTHWTPTGARLAAQASARQLQARAGIIHGDRTFQSIPVQVHRTGDICEMTQVQSAQAAYPPQTVVCEQISDPALGLLLPAASGRPGTFKFPGAKSTVLVPEPRSLGDLAEPAPASKSPNEAPVTKKLLPGSAGFISLLARELGQPVDAIVSDGGAATGVRQQLCMNPEILEGKKVVLWEFVERDIDLGAAGWQDVPLPAKLN
jgi:hypothetical protein